MAETIPGFKITWLPLLAASLTRAIWEIAWIPRTEQVQRIHDELEAAAEEEGRQHDLATEILREQERTNARREKRPPPKRRTQAEMKEQKRQHPRTGEKRPAINTPRPAKKKQRTAKPSTAEEEESEEEEIPIIPRKRKAVANDTTNDHDPCTFQRRQSKRIKNNKAKTSNTPPNTL